jgi:hypothetical protein
MAGGFIPPPFRVCAAAGYQDLVRTTIITIRTMSTTTPTPSSLAGEPPAGPHRRSHALTRRLGGCEDERSAIWIFLFYFYKADPLRSEISQTVSQ